MASSETFLVTSPVVQIIFGGLLALGAAPALFFQFTGYLAVEDIGVMRGSETASILTAAVMLLIAIAIMTWRYRATVDGSARTITWSRHSLGFSWVVAIWSRQDTQAIEVIRMARPTGYHVFARGDRTRKLLYVRADSTGLTLASGVARRLRVPREEPAQLPAQWWESGPMS